MVGDTVRARISSAATSCTQVNLQNGLQCRCDPRVSHSCCPVPVFLTCVCSPWVAGISGGPDGCYSVALSGGYEDDVDLGVAL